LTPLDTYGDNILRIYKRLKLFIYINDRIVGHFIFSLHFSIVVLLNLY
jgi:hypothetical protein